MFTPNAIQTFETYTGAPDWIAYVALFVFGAAVGSFLNVVIHRVPREESIVFPNSACPKCGTAIRPYDNIPILSWLILRGKCRVCKAGISIRYPAVELLNALLWVAVYFFFGFAPMLAVGLVFCSVTIALMFIDAEHMILPNAITYPFVVGAFVVRLAFPLLFLGPQFSDLTHGPLVGLTQYPDWLVSVTGGVLGALAGGGSLWAIGELWKRLRGVEAMGLGDVKMMVGFGAILGWRLSILAIFLAAFAGALIGMAIIATKKDKNLQTQIPFGIFLGIGSVIALLVGDKMIDWYLGYFG